MKNKRVILTPYLKKLRNRDYLAFLKEIQKKDLEALKNERKDFD